MDGDSSKPLTPEPLTTEQAKARLRAAAERASPSHWFERHQWGAIGLALAGGFILSRVRLPVLAGAVASRWAFPLLMGIMSRDTSTKTPPDKNA